MNDMMGAYVANEVIKLMLKNGIQILHSDILILGFTFKENCPDIRNTKVIDIYKTLKEYDINISVYDPWTTPTIVKREYGIEVTNKMPSKKYDTVILAVAHKEFNDIDINKLVKDIHIIFDVKGILNKCLINGRL